MISASTKIEVRDEDGATMCRTTISEAFPEAWDRSLAIAVLRRDGAAWFGGGAAPAVFVVVTDGTHSAPGDVFTRRLVALGVPEAEAAKLSVRARAS